MTRDIRHRVRFYMDEVIIVSLNQSIKTFFLDVVLSFSFRRIKRIQNYKINIKQERKNEKWFQPTILKISKSQRV